MPSSLYPPPAAAATLFIIRAALLMGVLSFAGVTLYIHSQGPRPPYPAAETLGWIVAGVWALLAAILLFVANRYRRATERAKRVPLAIAGWAVGEAAALLGGVHYFLTGEALRFGFGLLIFCVALVMLPIPADEPRR